MKSSDITVTDARLKKVFKQTTEITSQKEIEDKIQKEVDKSKIHLAEMVKFYPYLDKAMVKINGSNKNVICKILHRCYGAVIDFYTPEGDETFCEVMKEACIIPRSRLFCMLAEIKDNTSEWLLLGFYSGVDELYIKPADMGTYKISNIAGSAEFNTAFGNGSFDIVTSDGLNVNEKEMGNVKTVEYYTKSEVDKLLEDLKNELMEDKDNASSRC